MKYLHVILFLGSLMLLNAACKKSNGVAPIDKPSVKTDSQIQLTVSFTPHIDTFYGKIYYSDGIWPLPASDSSDSYAYIYVYYRSPNTILFSNNRMDGPYYCESGFNENFPDTSTDYYAMIYQNDTFGLSNYSFRFVKDSLYYFGVINDCTESYINFIAGKKISSSNLR